VFSFLFICLLFFSSLFYFLLQFSHLRRDNRDRRLDVVVLEVALEVEDRDLLSLRRLEELAERGVRVDVLLVVELVALDVVHDATGDVRAAHLRALRLAEEDAELVRDLLGLGEDRRLLGEGVARLIELRRLRAAAATRLLDLAGETLLELLHVGEHCREHRAEAVHLLHEAVELGNHVYILLHGDSCSGGRGDVRHNGGRGRGCDRGGGCRGGNGGGNGGGLGAWGLGGLGCSGTHLYIEDRGSFWLQQTRGCLLVCVRNAYQFWPKGLGKTIKKIQIDWLFPGRKPW